MAPPNRNLGGVGPSVPGAARLAAWTLRKALVRADGSATVQEGLYQAYKWHLVALEEFEGPPHELLARIHTVIVDLRRVFGFDRAGNKISSSVLRSAEAQVILERLRELARDAESIAQADGPVGGPPPGASH